MTQQWLKIEVESIGIEEIKDACAKAIFQCPPDNLHGANFYAHPYQWERLIGLGVIRPAQGEDKYYRIWGVPVFVGGDQVSFCYFDE